MSARRTKKSRIKTAQRRKVASPHQSTIHNEAKVNDLLHYDTSLIVKDLQRTLVASLIVFGVLVALYYQL